MIEFIILFLLGLITGSFLNVCIYRLPRGLSIIRPGSRCPECSSPIRPVDNIPILSFFILRGRCRVCGARIHWRYPLVELLNGLLWGLGFYKFGLSISLLPVLIFLSSLIVVTFIDLEHMVIPDLITIPGVLLGISSSFIMADPFLRYEHHGILNSLKGALAGFLLFLTIAKTGRWVFKKEAMGGGDIKLMAMVGAFTGWKGVILTTFAGSLIGSIIGIAIIIKRKSSDTVIPFGPYLAMGATIAILFGQEILNLWMKP